MSKTFFYINKPQQDLPVEMTYEDIIKIDSYPDNSISDIIINDLLDFYEYETEFELLKLIVSKLQIGGKIEIQAADISELCLASANLKVDIDITKSILHKKKSTHTIYDILNMLGDLKLEIIEKKYVNIFEYYILAIKNEK